MLGQFSLRDDAAALVHQVGEDAKLVARQLDRHAGQRHARRARVERQRAAAQLGRHLAAGAANQRPQPCEDFLDPERLGNVVVRAAIDPLYLLVPAAARREHQHRHGYSRVAPAAEQGEPIDLRQPEIEHDRVVLLRVAEEIGAFALGRAVDGIARVAKGGFELPRQQRFVFDDQYAHGSNLATT